MAIHLETRPRFKLVVLALACLATAPALAQKADPFDTFSFGVGGSFAYDDNLLRLDDNEDPEDGRSRGTWINSQFARAEMDLPISRQRIRAGVTANRYRYDEYSYLNWEGLDYNAGWLWEVGNLWEGDLSYRHRKVLSGLSDFQANTQNLQDIDIYTARAQYKFIARWAATVDFTRVTTENDGENTAGDDVSINDWETDTFGMGVKYYSTPDNTLAFSVRRTNGDYPNRSEPAPGSVSDTGFRQNDYGFEVDYGTGPWKWEGGVAYTQRRYDNLSGRDFSGITANLSADWQITGKTGLRNSWRRNLRDIETAEATYILVNSFSIAPYWQATEKIRVEMPLSISSRDYEGDVAGGSQREDRFRHIGLDATWRPTANWYLALSIEHSTRNSNKSNRDFDANTASVSAQFLF